MIPSHAARRSTASGARSARGRPCASLLASGESALKAQAEAADAADPRVDWLLREARAWKDAGQKTLVFAAHRETLEMLRTAFTNRAQLATGVFHESLSSARRDIEVAQFRRPEGPSLLVSTECGGEGRNFEFCQRLVLFDLPWNPVVVEQRIGRLDRIGRRLPVEIVYFRPPGGIGAEAVRLLEAIGVFREPLAGLEPQLAHVENALDGAALEPGAVVATGAFEALVTEASIARARIREAAYHELHRDRYGPELADGIFARIPADLDSLNEDVVVAACERLGFEVERQRGRRGFAITFGNQAIVDSLPGVPGGSSFLGTFDREEAVFDETLDFFASGHALVEGVLAHLEESPLGRVCRPARRDPRRAGPRAPRPLQGRAGVRRRGDRRRRAGASGLGGGARAAPAAQPPGGSGADAGPGLGVPRPAARRTTGPYATPGRPRRRHFRLSSKPSSFQPVKPPIIFLTGRPSRASATAALSAPLQCGPAQ